MRYGAHTLSRAKSFARDDFNHTAKVTNCEARIDNIN